MSADPPKDAGRFASDAAQVEAAKLAERDLYDNMVRTNGRLKVKYEANIPAPGTGFSYRLDPSGHVVETMCHRVHVVWKLNPAGTDYILVTMYPIP